MATWERIGPPDCPILFRRELFSHRLCKVMVHRFLPFTEDRDFHDHPRGFLTLVLRGGYDDLRPDGTIDRVRAPALRYRHAEYAHVTRTGKTGAVTLVIMGKLTRPWGFWRGGKWWSVGEYERVFGFAFRCSDLVDHDRLAAVSSGTQTDGDDE